MEYALKLDGIVTGFSVDDKYIDCVCGTKVIKAEKSGGGVVMESELFKKEGLARDLISNNGQLIIKDFCTLYILDKSSHVLVQSLQLGKDLSSDICGITCDGDRIYAAIRNGNITVIDRKTFEVKNCEISSNSLWDLKVYKEYLIGGTVGGKLLKINKKEMAAEKALDIGRQNIGSVLVADYTAYAAGQDKKLSKIDLPQFEIEAQKKNAHQKMFHCAGIFQNNIVTISHPCGEIAFWDKGTLDLVKKIELPLSLCGGAVIEKDLLYFTSRNIKGIAFIRLGE